MTFIFSSQEQSDQQERQTPSRAIEECILICQHSADLQPNTNSEEEVDWTQAAQAYPNLEEMPTFITQQRELAAEHSFTSSADPQ